MNRAKVAQSVISDQENNDGLAEMELQKLQRQYRIMEGDRKAYSEESRTILKKQKLTIDQLRQDNRTLANDIKLIEARIRGSEEVGSSSFKAQSLSEQQDGYLKRMKQLHQNILEANEECLKLEHQIAEQREKMGGNNATQINMAIQKQIRVMENRLDKALVKFNKSLATNKQLRQVIDNLRRERAVFESVYRKLERELMEQKKQMADIIEASNNAYETRDEAQAKMMALKEKAEKEFQAFTQEIKELDRVLEQDRKFKNFMSVKNAARGSASANANNHGAGGVRGAHGAMDGNLLEKGQLRGSQENITDNVEDYDRAIGMIKEVTGITDINELVQKFNDIEEQNFSLFNYVNEVNNQVERVNEEIGEVRERIDKYQSSVIKEENDRKAIVKEREEKLAEARQQVNLYDADYQRIIQTFEALQLGMGKIRGRLEAMGDFVGQQQQQQQGAGVAKKPSNEQLPSAAATNAPTATSKPADGETDKSYLLEELGWIENKANDLVMSNFLHSLPRRSAEEKENATAITLTFGGITMQGSVQPLMNYSIQAPSTGDDFDSDDEGNDDFDRPMTFEELRIKSLKGIAKREKNSGGSRSKSKKKMIAAE